MVIGAAVKEAAARGVVLQPLFSLYSFHGPVFRVLLRVTRSREWPAQHYGFLAHCYLHGQTYVVPWDKLGGAYCRCCRQQLRAQKVALVSAQSGAAAAAAAAAAAVPEDTSHGDDADMQQTGITASLSKGAREQVVIISSRSGYQQVDRQQSSHSTCSSGSSSTDSASTATTATTSSSSPVSPGPAPSVLSGPQWTGPLHDAAFVAQLAAEAAARGWRGSGVPPGSPHMVRQSRNNK
jgi:tRNA G26 N,N-dimethylase Trm1